MNFAINNRVRAFHPAAGRTLTGKIVAADAGHYHAVVNGASVWVVRWDNGTTGTGWRSDDLRAA